MFHRRFEKNITPTKWFKCKQKAKTGIKHIKENPADLLLVALGAFLGAAFEIDEITEV